MTTQDDLLEVLRRRFEANSQRHPGLAWAGVLSRLEQHPTALESLRQMEHSGGEPDVVVLGDDADAHHDSITFCDCSAETPSGRRSLCYDRAALDSRKEHKPNGSSVEKAGEMGIELLSEEQYRQLQALGEFDLKTSSWVSTPAQIRALGGALFGDRRYGREFIYHNGAQSYYAARGFRGLLRV